MSARRRRKRKQDETAPLLLGCGALGVFAAFGFVVLFVEAVGMHPVRVGIPTVLVASLVVWGVVKHRQDRRRHELRQREIQFAQSREIARYHAMNPKEFEHALGFLCERDGCTKVQVIGGAGDLGADVVAFAPDGRKIVLQAKRYGPASKVSGPDLQRFGGTCFSVHQAQIAAVVTTSGFTKQAREYAARTGIQLFDENCLAGWASRTGRAPWH